MSAISRILKERVSPFSNDGINLAKRVPRKKIKTPKWKPIPPVTMGPSEDRTVEQTVFCYVCGGPGIHTLDSGNLCADHYKQFNGHSLPFERPLSRLAAGKGRENRKKSEVFLAPKTANDADRRELLYCQQNATCHYCGQYTLFTQWTVDHKHPRSQGGKRNAENTVGACFTCNNAKGNIPYEEFIETFSRA